MSGCRAKRRRWIRAAVLLLSMSVAAGAHAAKVVKLSLWGDWGLGEPMAKSTVDLIEQFQKQYPHIQIKYSSSPPVTEKLLISSAAGNPPDMIYVNARDVVDVVNRGLLQPIGRPFTSDDLTSPLSREKLIVKGKIYALPYGATAIGLYGHKNVMSQAGLDPSVAPDMIDQVMTYARKMTRDTNGDGKPDVYGLTWESWLNFHMFGWLLTSAGGEFTNKTGTEVAFKTQTGLDVLNIFIDPVKRGYAQNASYEALIRAKTGMVVTIGERAQPLLSAKVPIITGPIPMVKSRIYDWNPWTIGIPKLSKHPNEAALFLEWMAKPERYGKWCADGMQIPSLTSGAESRAYKEFLRLSPWMKPFSGQLKYAVPIMHLNAERYFIPLWDQMLDIMNKAIASNISAEMALDKMAAAWQAKLNLNKKR